MEDLQALGEDHHVEGAVGIIHQVRVGIALHHGQAARHGGVDAPLAQLQAPAVHVAYELEELQQITIAAADVQDPGIGWHHGRDKGKSWRRPPSCK